MEIKVGNSNGKSHIREYLKQFSYFDEWDDSMIDECCNLSKIRTYKTDEVILRKGTDSWEYVHFILDGSCKVIQILINDPNIQSRNGEENLSAKSLKFMKIYSLSRSACFNVGETLINRMVVSSSHKTTCLLIPRYWILFKNERLWHRIRFFFQHNIPTADEVSRRYHTRKEFSAYGKDLLNEVLQKSKKSRINQDFNIPYSIRLNGHEL